MKDRFIMKTELLAPAGDIEAGYAALYYGADAVYLGLQQFSARATATNFSEDNLNEFVGYAHHLGRKVYAAINTLVQEDELPDLLKTLDICSRCKVDAVILQDLGVARIIRESYPELEMHASTQMAVHNKEGALALQKQGFSRVVVARELTLNEIKEIAAIPGLETEAFVHGALCYSYSGVCLFSSLETGRSANRGKCLYPCRSNFKGEAGEKHYFSMKDMALQEDILKMPVTSLKIEGRKKTALYVAAVTDYYRRILDGKGADENRAEHIKQIFSRPWCKFHFRGKDKGVIEREFVGHRGLLIGKVEQAGKGRLTFHAKHKVARYDGLQIEIPGVEKPFGFSVQRLRLNGQNVFEAPAGEVISVDLPPQTPNLEKGWEIYLASATEVKGAYDYAKPKPGEYRQKPKVDVVVEVLPEQLIARSGRGEAQVAGVFASAQNVARVEEAVRQAFAKSGDAAVVLGNLELHNPDGLFVPASLLNDLRRQLYAQIIVEYKTGVLPSVEKIVRKMASKWIIKTDDWIKISAIDLDDVDEIVYLLNEKTNVSDLKKLPKNKLRLALPVVCRRVDAFKPLINSLVAQGYKKWEIGNYWGLSVLPEKGIDLSFDAPLYMMNTQAMAMAKEMNASRVTLSVEDRFENLKKLAEEASLPVVMTVYQDPALFTSAACIRSNVCKDCSRGEKWLSLSKDGQKYQALSRDCQTMLFAGQALCFAKEAAEVKADFYRADFVYKPYTAEQAVQIWNKLRRFEDVENTRKGNLHRSL